MRPSAYLRVVNTTSLLKTSVKQLASKEKFTKQECGGTHDHCFVFSLPFIWLGLSILFFSSTCINMPPWDHITSYTDEQK